MEKHNFHLKYYPLKGQHIHHFDNIDPLMEFKPILLMSPIIAKNIDWRSGKWPLKKGKWKRPGTVGICAAIQKKNVNMVLMRSPHICGGLQKEDTENLI
jgi:hypothetical protein